MKGQDEIIDMATSEGTAMSMTLEFNSLTVEIDGKTILDNISGCVKPGEVLAVMGPSGSGKTTLLNFLAGRKVGDVKSGEVLLNGEHITKKLKRKLCYVLQEDLFFDNLTLKETLTYSALLRLPEKMTKAEKLKKVDEVVEVLDLKKCVNTKMGNSLTRGLSGGEKKRANIGCELIMDPSLIYLDEPTSGLDSSNAYNLVKTLETLAEKEAKTIVMTIHQPSSQIFHLFHKLLLLVNGKVAYYGNASDAIEFFKINGFECEAHFNPADYILDVLTSGAEVEKKIVAACKEWIKDTPPIHVRVDKKSLVSSGQQDNDSSLLPPLNYSLENEAYIQEDHGNDSLNSKHVNCSAEDMPANSGTSTYKDDSNPTDRPNELSNKSSETPSIRYPAVSYEGTEVQVGTSVTNNESDQRKSMEKIEDSKKHGHRWGPREDEEKKWPTGFWTQFCVLTHRTFKQSLPTILSKLNLVQNIMLAFVIGFVYFQIPLKEETIEDKRGMLFFYIMYWGFTPLFQALISFPAEEVIIRKERAAGSYRLSAYYLGKCVSEAPLVVCYPVGFLLIVYFLCGLNPSVAFLGQVLNLVVNALLSQSVGMAIGATVMSFTKGIVVAAVSMIAMMLVAGYFTQNVPFWLQWLGKLSFLTYSYENCLIIEYTGIGNHTCAKVTSYPSCRNNGTTTISGEEILKHMDIEHTFGENLAILIGFTIAFRIIGYCSLRFLHKPE